MRHIFLFVFFTTLFSCCHTATEEKKVGLKEERLDLIESKDTATTVEKTEAFQVTINPQNTIRAHTTETQSLVLTPLSVSGDIGNVTFSQKGKTVFYFDAKSKGGKIKLNGTEYILNKMEGSYEGSYKLSGDNVSIRTTKGEWEEMESDCGYGKALVVSIKMGIQELKLNNVEVQDCLGMIE